MNNERFVYVTYIAATVEMVLDALIKGELTRQYWKHENVSDWKPGSPWKMVSINTERTVMHVGKVLEIIPPKRLVLSWGGASDSPDSTMLSKAAIDIELVGEMVKLTITHDQLSTEMAKQISGGWPLVLSSLKSFLETGKPLEIFSK